MLFRRAICFLLAFSWDVRKIPQKIWIMRGTSKWSATGMVADLARHRRRSRSRYGLMGPGVDPHYYKAYREIWRNRALRSDLV